MRLAGLLILILLILSGCVATTAPTPAPPDATAAAAEDPDPAMDVAITELQFEGNGNTFLEHIADVISAGGDVESHRYVETTDSAGMTWQGEELLFAGQTVVLLQPIGSGGGIGIELRTPPDVDWRSGLDHAGLTMAEEVLRPDPEIRFVRARQTGDGLWSVDVTLAYPDTGWEDYADGWHVATTDGEILATRILLHPHENEQPFTRGQGNISVPKDVTEIVVRAHTLVGGYGAETVTVPLANVVQTDRYEVAK